MTEIPSTDVIRHWVAWDNDEHDYERVKLFDAWLREIQAQAWSEGTVVGYRDRQKNTYTLNPYAKDWHK